MWYANVPSVGLKRTESGFLMAVTAELISYPADVYDNLKTQGDFYPPDGMDIRRCFIDRSWDELHLAFRSFEHPVNLALSGDYGYDGGLDRFGWDASCDNDHYIGLLSSVQVAAVAAHLAKLTFQQVADALSEAGRGSDYLAPRFHALVEFYAEAAANNNSVFVHVA